MQSIENKMYKNENSTSSSKFASTTKMTYATSYYSQYNLSAATPAPTTYGDKNIKSSFEPSISM